MGSRDLGGGGRQEAGARGTYRVLGGGARRHGEEELFPEHVRDPREARPWCGSIGTGPRVAGGVHRQADIGSGAQGPFWYACRGQLSPVFQGLTLGLAAVVQGPYKERRGVRGPCVLTDHRDTLLGDEVLPGSVPSPQHHSSPPPTPAPASSPPETSLARPAWTAFSRRHPVHLEAGDQPSGQQTNETRQSREAAQAPESRCPDGAPPAPRPARNTCSRSWAGRSSSCVANSAAVRKTSRLGLRSGNAITWPGRGPLSSAGPGPQPGPTLTPEHPPIRGEEPPIGPFSHSGRPRSSGEKHQVKTVSEQQESHLHL